MREQDGREYTAKIESPVYPTEEEERVMSAINNILPGDDYAIGQNFISGEANLSNLRDMLKQQRTRDTARAYLLSHVGPPLTFLLSKQAASAGSANLVESPGPLGEIRVDVEGDQEEIINIIDWLTGNECGDMVEEAVGK